MKKQSLHGAWTLEIPGTAFGSVPARVPGSVYHDLLTAGMIARKICPGVSLSSTGTV